MTATSAPTLSGLLRYGALGLPLAFCGLPIYVHVPKFYADVMQVDLGLLGALLLFIRLFDAFLDPIIGMLCDRYHSHSRLIMALSVPVLIAGYIMLFNPAHWAYTHALAWLTVALALVYLSFSTLMINYYAMGMELAVQYHDHTRVAAFRESFMLVGVLLASMLPSLLMLHGTMRQAYGWFSLLLAPLLLLGAWITLSRAPAHVRGAYHPIPTSFVHLLKNSEVRCLLIVAFCNAIPTAITSTLFLFFTTDVLQAGKDSGGLLAAYFLSAAFGMPVWAYVSARQGKKQTLLIAMCIAIACFIWAWRLGAGDVQPFLLICILSGLTLGADAMLLPSMLADSLSGQREASATGFGLWNLTGKLAMAFAAGIVLPLLALAGYHSSGMPNDARALAQLSFCYALLPCLFKLVAVGLLYFSPLDQRRNYAI